jgi:hypothetical protein
LIVYFLDHPYERRVGGIKPTAMRHTLILIHNVEPTVRPACNGSGRPL